MNIYIKKLYDLITNSPDTVIKWNTKGTHLIIIDIKYFEKYLKEKEIFRSYKFSAFKRQLCFYNFKKLRNNEVSVEIKKEVNMNIGEGLLKAHVFYHPYFRQGRHDLLSDIITTNLIRKKKKILDLKKENKNLIEPKQLNQTKCEIKLNYLNKSDEDKKIKILKEYPSFYIPTLYDFKETKNDLFFVSLFCNSNLGYYYFY